MSKHTMIRMKTLLANLSPEENICVYFYGSGKIKGLKGNCCIVFFNGLVQQFPVEYENFKVLQIGVHPIRNLHINSTENKLFVRVTDFQTSELIEIDPRDLMKTGKSLSKGE